MSVELKFLLQLKLSSRQTQSQSLEHLPSVCVYVWVSLSLPRRSKDRVPFSFPTSPLRTRWIKRKQSRTHPTAKGSARLCYTENSRPPTTERSGIPYVWQSLTSLFRRSHRHLQHGARWYSTWETVSAAKLSREMIAQTLELIFPPIFTLLKRDGWVPAWPVRGLSCVFV